MKAQNPNKINRNIRITQTRKNIITDQEKIDVNKTKIQSFPLLNSMFYADLDSGMKTCSARSYRKLSDVSDRIGLFIND